MTKKRNIRYSVSYRSLQDEKACNLKLNSMLPLDENAIENFFLTCVDCELTELYKSLVGYNYENVTIKYRSVSFMASYLYGTQRLTTDRIIIKHVKKAYADKTIIENWFKNIYGSSFRIDAFSVLNR